MGNFEKGDNLPHCLRQKFLPLYTIHGVMLYCRWHIETFDIKVIAVKCESSM
jgi:hypothetical protein